MQMFRMKNFWTGNSTCVKDFGIIIDHKLNIEVQCYCREGGVKSTFRRNRNIVSKSQKVIFPLYTTCGQISTR